VEPRTHGQSTVPRDRHHDRGEPEPRARARECARSLGHQRPAAPESTLSSHDRREPHSLQPPSISAQVSSRQPVRGSAGRAHGSHNVNLPDSGGERERKIGPEPSRPRQRRSPGRLARDAAAPESQHHQRRTSRMRNRARERSCPQSVTPCKRPIGAAMASHAIAEIDFPGRARER
jgi:hypothetical protein